MYVIAIGIEHLRTGIEFECNGNLTFHYNTPTMFMACSLQPFSVWWPVKRIRLQAQYERGYELPTYSHDDVVVPKVTLE